MTLYVEGADSYLGIRETAESVRIGANECRMLIPTDATGDRLGLFSLSLAPNGPHARPHYHRVMTELFIVHSGEVRLTRGDEEVTGTAGTALYVPPGAPHGFANTSGEQAELLIAFVPGLHRERFFRGLADLIDLDTAPTPAELAEFATRFDQYTVRE
ncbi:cupin domain-containing protein [Actinokineospora enzanensis]|uniref:cupin domain-containing protein n=1 Tax=Actinokineospora enzanensis TaxID=155975 RepID=UPI00036DC462|nr:cupin domain-containing protein [Actinokineospora enzanensis]